MINPGISKTMACKNIECSRNGADSMFLANPKPAKQRTMTSSDSQRKISSCFSNQRAPTTASSWSVFTCREINAALDPGEPVPGQTAFRETPGAAIDVSVAKLKIGDKTFTTKCPSNAKKVVFKVPLEAGSARLATTFESGDGTVYGAYFVYVEKK